MREFERRKEEEDEEIYTLEAFVILTFHLTDFVRLRFKTGVQLNER
jgi:hypothetical protein